MHCLVRLTQWSILLIDHAHAYLVPHSSHHLHLCLCFTLCPTLCLRPRDPPVFSPGPDAQTCRIQRHAVGTSARALRERRGGRPPARRVVHGRDSVRHAVRQVREGSDICRCRKSAGSDRCFAPPPPWISPPPAARTLACLSGCQRAAASRPMSPLSPAAPRVVLRRHSSSFLAI